MYRRSDADVRAVTATGLVISADILRAFVRPGGFLAFLYLGFFFGIVYVLVWLWQLAMNVCSWINQTAHSIYSIHIPVPWHVNVWDIPYALVGDFYYVLIIFPLQCYLWVCFHWGFIAGLLGCFLLASYFVFMSGLFIGFFEKRTIAVITMPGLFALLWYGIEKGFFWVAHVGLHNLHLTH